MFTGGLKRFGEEGYRFTEASHAHANTETAVGHATLATGVFPTRSGIVGNGWTAIDADGTHAMYAVEDRASPILGQPDAPGRSPANLERGGLADWILAADPEARIASISLKDRAAITLVGRAKGEVYWILPERGRFVTSTYYHAAYPAWVQRFNDQVMPDLLSDTAWNTTVPEARRHRNQPRDAVLVRSSRSLPPARRRRSSGQLVRGGLHRRRGPHASLARRTPRTAGPRWPGQVQIGNYFSTLLSIRYASRKHMNPETGRRSSLLTAGGAEPHI